MAMFFSLVLIAALVGVIKPYVKNMRRWHFGVLAATSFVIVGVTGEPTNDSAANTVAVADVEKAPVAAQASETSADASEASAAGEPAENENPLADRSVQMNWVIMSQDGVKARLRDPNSADFRNVGFYSGGAAAGVCGEVNAKNGFGGYTGFVRFIASGENTVFLASDTTAKEFGEAWNSICVKADTDDVQIP